MTACHRSPVGTHCPDDHGVLCRPGNLCPLQLCVQALCWQHTKMSKTSMPLGAYCLVTVLQFTGTLCSRGLAESWSALLCSGLSWPGALALESSFSLSGNWTQSLNYHAILVFHSYWHQPEANQDEGQTPLAFQMPNPAAFTVCTEGNKTNYNLPKELSMGGYALESGQRNASCKPFSPGSRLRVSLLRVFAAQGPLPRAISEGAGHY